jgi:hypothetical protein
MAIRNEWFGTLSSNSSCARKERSQRRSSIEPAIVPNSFETVLTVLPVWIPHQMK